MFGRGLLGAMILVVAIAGARPSKAGEPLGRDFALAWPHYRDAWVQSSAGDGPATRAALDAFTAAWTRLLEDGPTEACRADTDCPDDLGLIGDIAGKAAAQAGRGRLADCHRTLQQIRAILGEMRRRDGGASYDDVMDAFEDKLAETGDDDLDRPELTPEQFIRLIEQAAVLAYLAEGLEKRAPAQWVEDPDFSERAESLARQVATLKAAVFTDEAAAVRAAVEDLRKNFDKFYLYYG